MDAGFGNRFAKSCRWWIEKQGYARVMFVPWERLRQERQSIQNPQCLEWY
jgi:hypothetical protein